MLLVHFSCRAVMQELKQNVGTYVTLRCANCSLSLRRFQQYYTERHDGCVRRTGMHTGKRIGASAAHARTHT